MLYGNEPNAEGKERIAIIDAGAASVQGRRPHQEDRYTIIPPTAVHGSQHKVAFYAIFDGHGGTMAAEHACTHLHRILALLPEFQKGKYEEAIRIAFRKEDEELFKTLVVRRGQKKGGTTAVISVVDVTAALLVVGNLGDARAVLGILDDRTHSGYRAERLTKDHKPTEPEEMARIAEVGGEVNPASGRIGTVNISRALGDFRYKLPLTRTDLEDPLVSEAVRPGANVKDDFVSVEPHITSKHLDPVVHHFLVLASDGVWNEMKDQTVIDLVAAGRQKGWDAHTIAKAIVKTTEKNLYSDNATCIVVMFGKPRTVEE
ncbi:hypothetical protein SpCBS45565_g00125 [Spizellomyces sp. 'palustris']|nr:hypothetical protein SpCBS45565_g00125 [Spizellomyces sp. 'palustris']